MIILVLLLKDIDAVILLGVEIHGVNASVVNYLSDVLRCSASCHKCDECADDHPLGDVVS